MRNISRRGSGQYQTTAVVKVIKLNVKHLCGDMKVVHCKKDKYDVYIGRPSKWGNPFIIGKHGDRMEVIEKYRRWIVNQPKLMGELSVLIGKVLGCWCKPNACHGDVLVELLKEAQQK